MKKKILFVAMQTSIHTARWINQISREEYEIHLFSINNMPHHPALKGDMIIHYPHYVFSKYLIQRKLKSISLKKCFHALFLKKSIQIKYIDKHPIINGLLNSFRFRRHPFGETDAAIDWPYRPKILNNLILEIKPDLIHSLEFQTCGYNVLYAKKLNPTNGEPFPKWLATNWGSDVYYYQHNFAHKSIIQNLLLEIDYYSCECKRDVEIVKALGYNRKILTVMPNTGGVNLEFALQRRNQTLPSLRKLIMVKGYQSFAGRALTALDAIEQCAAYLKDFNIIVYSASTKSVFNKIHALREKSNLSIEALPHEYDHDKMLALFSQARVYLSVSVSDGISTSLLEAISMGAFPIQTNTSCCEEWIVNGITGYTISPNELDNIVSCLKEALLNDPLVDKASQLNWNTVVEKLDSEKCTKQVSDMYSSIMTPKENAFALQQ